MRIGTKSILFGAHAFYLHPWIVALGWCKLYGFPWDPRLWIAFVVHDLGYIGKPNMDGLEGEEHVWLGARIMGRLFDRGKPKSLGSPFLKGGRWEEFTIRHSRYWCKRSGVEPSRLCYADKLAISLTPAWIYLPMVRATGEIDEYRSVASQPFVDQYVAPEYRRLLRGDEAEWYEGVRRYCRDFALEHAQSGGDRWTGRREHWTDRE